VTFTHVAGSVENIMYSNGKASLDRIVVVRIDSDNQCDLS